MISRFNPSNFPDLTNLSEMERLAAGVAHEMNTPLTVVRVTLESALISSGCASDRLQRALQAVDMMEATITDLLSYTRRVA